MDGLMDGHVSRASSIPREDASKKKDVSQEYQTHLERMLVRRKTSLKCNKHT
jgi:hypothetical protein